MIGSMGIQTFLPELYELPEKGVPGGIRTQDRRVSMCKEPHALPSVLSRHILCFMESALRPRPEKNLLSQNARI